MPVQLIRFHRVLISLIACLLGSIGVQAQSQCYQTEWFSEEGQGAVFCHAGYAARGMECSGRYCDNKRLTCCAYTGAYDPGARFAWSQPFSEENQAAQWNPVAFVVGIACSGRYCDNLKLNLLMSPRLRNAGECRWTPWFSEEGNSSTSCESSEFVSAVKCSGSYCDNLALKCCRFGQ